MLIFSVTVKVNVNHAMEEQMPEGEEQNEPGNNKVPQY